MKKKRCVLCDFEFEYDDKVNESVFVRPYGEGAEYYHDLWHFHVDKCPNCGYASRDISHTYNKLITHDESYKAIGDISIIVELNEVRPNRVEAYMKAAYYYDSISDIYNSGRCLLQAGDLVYAELLYWDEYVFNSKDSLSALVSQAQYKELKKFADHLYNSAIQRLEDFVKEEPNHVDAWLLLAGSLLDGDKVQVIRGTRMLSSIADMELTGKQRSALDFLKNDVR